ncbi:GNAT family N-acetyltransferase [Aerococcaceae bacterium zg-B36]|uniref:GNAT family N-acetyltransferase n=1 Tax=Aerococcaceae bacterium zg-252 TaxID=2796928 RepID=UPI001BD87396|nr:GNAT family N-acetyltransferase [Aerococcaceae bacterium zg-B36]
MKLTLRKPNLSDKEELIAYCNAFGETPNGIEGTSFLTSYESIEEWLHFLEILEREETAPDNLVPAHQYVLVDDNQRILGMINLRLKLNDYLAQYGGHVGYSILPNVRGLGFGSQQLALLLPIARQLGMEKLLITASETNGASQKVIENNGGVFEQSVQFPEENDVLYRYWLTLEP